MSAWRRTVATMPQLEVTPSIAPSDAAIRIVVRDVPVGAAVTVRTRLGRSGAEAVFVADEHGVVDVAAQAPVSGSYAGVDAMGLVWSMAPASGGWLVISAEVGGDVIPPVEVERQSTPAGVRREVVRSDGLVGTLFSGPEPAPGVLLIGGSEGGLHESDAALLAAHGFTVLALAYFGMRGVPATLERIPLEYFETAVDFLLARPQVSGDRVGVLGGSRGGEAGLLIGSVCDRVGAVVSTVGSGVVTQGIGSGAGLLDILATSGPAWTYRGRVLPYLPYVVPAELRDQVEAGVPVQLRLAFDPAQARPEMAIECSNALLLSCGDDQMWPSTALSERARGGRHVDFPEAGHGIATPPYGSTTELTSPGPGVTFAMGGSPAANAAARESAWRLAREFLADRS